MRVESHDRVRGGTRGFSRERRSRDDARHRARRDALRERPVFVPPSTKKNTLVSSQRSLRDVCWKYKEHARAHREARRHPPSAVPRTPTDRRIRYRFARAADWFRATCLSETSRDTPSRRTQWLARARAPLCPRRRGLEARRTGAATRTPRWSLSRDPTRGSARAAARWWRLSRPLTVACLGARPPPRPGPPPPRRRPLALVGGRLSLY